MSERMPAPAAAGGRRFHPWLALSLLLNFPGLVAFGTYAGSWAVSKVLFDWLGLPSVHLFVMLALLFFSALAPLTSLLAVATVLVLALLRKLTGKHLLLASLLTTLACLGAVLVQLWWARKIVLPGVPS